MSFFTGLTRYAVNNCIAFDQLLNTLLGGDPDETISSRMGKRMTSSGCRICTFWCQLLNFFEDGHCHKSAARNLCKRNQPRQETI